MRFGAAVVLVAALCSSAGCQAGPDAPAGSTAREPAPAASSRDAAAPSDRTVHRRAVELTIWGMPAVSMAATRQALKRDLDADFGDVVYFSQVAEPRHEFLTANNQTPYVMTFFDLRRGPMVLDVPPASSTTVFFGSAIDSWEVPLADIGPSGDDAGKGGRYLFLPPGYQDKPPAGYFVVLSETVFVHIALRPISVGKGTLADAVAYSQRLKTYLLADPARPTRYVDAYPKALKTLPTFDVNDLRLLAESIDVEPPQAKDAAMLAMAASIGIEKGKPFQPDAARTQLLNDAIREGKEAMNDYFMNHAFDRFWPNRQWMALKAVNNFGFSYYGGGLLDYENRAGGFSFWATFAPKRLADPGKLPASYYLNAFRDSAGVLFRGDTLYQIRMPADTPAHDFWSIIAYEVGTNAFIHNPENRVGVSSYDKSRMAVNADGSVDVYIGPTAPEGLTANWIPTAGKDFWLLGRFYGPDKALFDKVWTMPDVEKARR